MTEGTEGTENTERTESTGRDQHGGTESLVSSGWAERRFDGLPPGRLPAFGRHER